MLAAALPAAREARALLNAWQRDLPLVAKPYDALGAAHGLSGAQVRAVLQGALDGGQASRISFGEGSYSTPVSSGSARAARACCARCACRPASWSVSHASSTPSPASTTTMRATTP
ncbi:MAG TPA: hypothetical protein PLG77_02645 [Burkholderiaceae bacterium]|nr:hypothetical protein [Burkholderiaceae bacterium]